MNNSLIDVYARWATISPDGTLTFLSEFKLTTASFPPVFAGTLPDNLSNEHYDPVYPPGDVNLHWWYSDWPLANEFGDPVLTDRFYRAHVGEYNGAWGDTQYVYVTWADNRLLAAGTLYSRNQSDIRCARIAWQP